MKNVLHIIMVSVILLPSSFSFAQNYTGDFKKIKENYDNKSLCFNMKYLYYPYDSVSRAEDSMQGYCCLEGKKFYYKITTVNGVCEYIRNDRYYFIVDHTQKVIALSKSSQNTARQMWDVSKIDSVLGSPSAKVTYKDKGKDGEYELKLGFGNWNRMKLVFSRESYMLEQVRMYSLAKGKVYGQSYDKPFIGIYYTGYKEKISDKNIFAEIRYFHSDKDGAIVLSDEYKGYKLLNYLKKQAD